LKHRPKLDKRVVSTLTALLCMTLVSTVGYMVSSETTYPFLVASMGAASVIMFCAPNSPMATYRAFLLGNILSAIVGVSISFIPLSVYVLAPIAVASAIGTMHIFKCQHPPGGATALVAVIGGTQISELGYLYALLLGTFFTFVIIQRSIVRHYQRADWAETTLLNQSQVRGENGEEMSLYSMEELHEKFHLGLDIKPAELSKVYTYLLTQERRGLDIYNPLGSLVEGDAPTIEYGDSLENAWSMMSQHNTDCLVVIDKFGRVDGLVTLRNILDAIGIPADQIDSKLVEEKIEQTQVPLSKALERGISFPIAVVNLEQKFVGLLIK